MGWLVEDPTAVLVAGGFIEAALAIALFTTGRGVIVIAMAATAILVVAGVLVEKLVVTEVERVQAMFDEISAAGEANDVEKVVSFVDRTKPTGQALEAWMRTGMSQVTIDSVSLYGLKIDVEHGAQPLWARARFRLHVTGRDNLQQIPYTNYSAIFEVWLEKHGDSWKFVDYKMQE